MYFSNCLSYFLLAIIVVSVTASGFCVLTRTKLGTWTFQMDTTNLKTKLKIKSLNKVSIKDLQNIEITSGKLEKECFKVFLNSL